MIPEETRKRIEAEAERMVQIIFRGKLFTRVIYKDSKIALEQIATYEHERLRPVIDAQKEYIKLLEKECNRIAGLSVVKPYLASSEEDISAGISCRKKIQEAEEALKL